MEFGIIDSISIGKNADGEIDVRLAVVVREGEDKVTVELPFSEGDEFVASPGDRVYFSEIDPGFLLADRVQTVMAPEAELSAGDREIFSRSGSSRAATVRLTSNGVITINKGEDYAVKFEALEAGLNKVVNDVNDLFTLIKTHGHPLNIGDATAEVSLELSGMTSVEMDISASKVDKVRI